MPARAAVPAAPAPPRPPAPAAVPSVSPRRWPWRRRAHRRWRRWERGLTLALLALTLALLTPAVASAHAHLVQADPAPESVLAHAPAVASFVFDEPLNPALTRIRVTTAAGRPVASGGHLGAGHNGELWELSLPPLHTGTYSVFWTSESATDGHVISSFYTFRIAASGGTDRVGAVTGAAAGVYGGGGGGSSGLGLGLGWGAWATALLHWLGLMAQALWLGALIIEVIVLAPARRAAGTASEPAHLARAAWPQLWWLVRGALGVTLLALAGEVLSLAMQGTGGDWGGALRPATLGGVLSSQNGHLVVLRCVVLLAALLLAARRPATATATARAPEPARRVRRSPQALGLTASFSFSFGAVPAWLPVRSVQSARWILLVLAAAYMLLVALSGHAADVTPGWLSYPIDWLHLLCTAAWAGGIAALAYAVLPARRLLPPEQRAPAVLPLLDRFSPVAYAAVGVLALSGLYNAVNHVGTPMTLVQTTYGQLLIAKIALVGLLLVLSATHVYGLRPRLAATVRAATPEPDGRLRGQGRQKTPPTRENMAATAVTASVAVHEGLATLAARLRLETGVGAAILLATALMGQTLPTNAVPAAGPTTTPSAISGTATTGDLRADLTVAPPAVGAATFTLRVWEKGVALSGDTAAAIIHLHPSAQPTLRATLDPTAQGTRFAARGSLAASGTWHADVLVRTAMVSSYRTLPFTFTVGAGAAFLAPGLNPDAVSIHVTPGRISAPNTFTVAGLPGTGVRLLSQSLDMNMGVLPYRATALGRGRWQVRNVYSPMQGRWGLTVQVQHAGGWTTVRQFVYDVPLSGPMRLLTPQRPEHSGTGAGSETSASGSGAGAPPKARSHNLSAPYNVAFARTLPYTALVTEMGSSGVRVLKSGELVHTGLQAHGVDVLDGTPYAYVTNFGAMPGTISQIDLRTLRVVRTFDVGIGPAHVVFTPDHRRAFVTNFRSNDLYEVNLQSGATRPIEFPNGNCFEPHGIDISPDGRTLYVACAGGAWIYTVSTQTLRPGRMVITAPGAIGVAVDAPRQEIWVTNQTANSVTVIDETTLRVLATIRVGKGPALLVPTPDGRTVYVADQFGNEVSVIDAASRRIVATIPVAAQPHGPDVTADGKYVYVASIGGNAVTIIRTSDNKVVAVVPAAVGSNEVAIAH